MPAVVVQNWSKNKKKKKWTFQCDAFWEFLFPGPTLIFFRNILVWQTALKLGYGVVLEFGSKVDPLPNASGGVDFKEFPFPGDNPNFFPKYFHKTSQGALRSTFGTNHETGHSLNTK